MPLLDRFRAAYNAFKNPEGDAVISDQPGLVDGLLPADHRERLAVLRDYYEATAYATLNDAAAKRGVRGLKMLDNPAYQAVEFHTAHLFPGSLSEALPVTLPKPTPARQEEEEPPDLPETPPEETPEGEVPPSPGPAPEEQPQGAELLDAIRRVWNSSNWQSEKQVYVRWLARDGEVFLQAATRTDEAGAIRRAYIRVIDSVDVSDFEEDERGFLIYIRLDTEQLDDNDNVWTRTEVWDKSADLHRVWIHQLGLDTDLDSLGAPRPPDVSEEDIEEGVDEDWRDVDESITSLGFDFVPFVHVRFIDSGEPRGVGVYEKFVVPIDEINRAVNRLHETYFSYDRPDFVLRRNEEGRGPADLRPEADEDEDGAADTVEIGDETLYRLPGNASLEQMIPDIPYDQGLAIIDKRVDRLSESLAELRFFQDVDRGDPSGISRRLRLAPAVSRAVEARANAENGIIRATQMCLTFGILAGLFPGIGDAAAFERGALDFEIERRGILHVSELERAEEDKAVAEVLGLYAKGIPSALFKKYLKDRGYDDDVIEAAIGQAEEASRPAPVPAPRLAGLLED